MTAAILLLAAAVHVHGQGQLDIAIESGQVNLYLTAPESDLVDTGNAGQAALETRFARDGLFSFSDASCRFDSSSVRPSTAFESMWEDDPLEAHADDNKDEHSTHEDHADYQISWTYECAMDPVRVRVELFQRTRLERIRFQALGASGVLAGELTPDSVEIELP